MEKSYKQEIEIEEFLINVTETEEYKAVEYLAFSIRIPMLQYISKYEKEFRTPDFLNPLVSKVTKLFSISGISYENILDYMERKNESGEGAAVWYYDCMFIRGIRKEEQVQFDTEKISLIIAGYILDIFQQDRLDIKEIIKGEQFVYNTNQYGLTLVPGVVFKSDSYIFDGKAYVYNILTRKGEMEFGDGMPGFARIITEDVSGGDILLRLDERLAVPETQMITYSTTNFEKFRGPQFHFSDPNLKEVKTIIVHIIPETANKLLMVVKKDYDCRQKKAFLHIEIETLPYYKSREPDSPCITTFLHGMYFPEEDCFIHIDYTKNQYCYSDYEKKYADADPNVPIDFYTEKKLHYKIWCIENSRYSREIWYKLMMVSLEGKRLIMSTSSQDSQYETIDLKNWN